MLESTTDSVFILDREWFTYLNPKAKEVISGGRDLLGVNFWEAFPEVIGSTFDRSYREAVARQEPVHLEKFHPPLGIWLEVHVYPSPDGLSVFFRDVTARHNVQEEIQRRMEEAKAASHANSAFLATMSHEIRTPVHGVLGLTEQLSMTRLDVEQRKLLSELQASGSALLTVINDVLDYSKIEAGKISVEKRPSDLRATVEAIAQIFRLRAEARQVRLSIVIDDDLSAGHRTDGGRVRQVLTNLVGNALKFTERGAVSVDVTCGPVADGHQTVTFAVSDTGIGIAPEELTRIFEPFEQADASTTRRFGGTGLGLTISKQLAQALGGELSAESVVGHGSTFTLSLDLEVVPEDEAAPRANAAEEVAPDIAGTRVLVAEDNRVNRIILSRLLNQAGCITTFAGTGTAAVRSTELQDFDIVLMDISMPEMDGYEATRTIRSREAREGLPMLPIIALTAHVEKNRREACITSGMQGMLSKPFRRAQILQAIADCLQAGGRDQEALRRTEIAV